MFNQEFWNQVEKEIEAGYEGPGWYFWDETWVKCYGPFNSENEAKVHLEKYIKRFL